MFSNVIGFFKKLTSLTKKVLIVLVVYAIVFSLFFYFFNQKKTKTAFDPIQKNRQQIYEVINDKELNSTKEGKILVKLFKGNMCLFMGEGCTDNPQDGEKNYRNSIFGLMSKLITAPYSNPPASGVYWAYSGLENSGFIPKTYAAEGIGFASLKPFMNIWKVIRDISYMILVVILIAIGFMIMFRTKINPQTVISVENALPRIVITLILITFSFAIAGFLIDLMYALIIIIIAVLGNQGNFFNITEFQNKYLTSNFGTITEGLLPLGFFPTLGKLSDAILTLIPEILNQILRVALGFIGTYIFGVKIAFPLGKSLLESVSELGGSIPIGESLAAIIEILLKGALIVLVPIIGFSLGYLILPLLIGFLISFTVIMMLFRIFFMMFTSYIKIFLMVILSPIFILFEAIPGQKAFSNWLKNLLGEILTFPLVTTFFVFSYLIINIIPSNGTIWRPPFLTEIKPESFTIMLAMGILFLIPELVKMAKDMMGIKPMPISFGIGTFFGGVGAAWTGTQTGLGTFSSLTQMPVVGRFILNKMPDKLQKTILPPTVGEQVTTSLQNAGVIPKTGNK